MWQPSGTTEARTWRRPSMSWKSMLFECLWFVQSQREEKRVDLKGARAHEENHTDKGHKVLPPVALQEMVVHIVCRSFRLSRSGNQICWRRPRSICASSCWRSMNETSIAGTTGSTCPICWNWLQRYVDPFVLIRRSCWTSPTSESSTISATTAPGAIVCPFLFIHTRKTSWRKIFEHTSTMVCTWSDWMSAINRVGADSECRVHWTRWSERMVLPKELVRLFAVLYDLLSGRAAHYDRESNQWNPGIDRSRAWLSDGKGLFEVAWTIAVIFV